MVTEAEDFLAESESLARLIEPLPAEAFEEKTQFKEWTTNVILRHLHCLNHAAYMALTDEAAFLNYAAGLRAASSMGAFELAWVDGMSGPELASTWIASARRIASAFRDADPKARLKWFGPPMSVRSSITARQMETWAHGQAVFDLLGEERKEDDRLRNIAHLGVNTYGWTFATRGLEPPGPSPHVKLAAPSGITWEWNEPSEDDFVSGDAAEFCQVVTQTRNVADTTLKVVGSRAAMWMSLAQCFAGGPSDPPRVGTRFRTSRPHNFTSNIKGGARA
jgi:uncharacterized protein (TIGR03084 family)